MTDRIALFFRTGEPLLKTLPEGYWRYAGFHQTSTGVLALFDRMDDIPANAPTSGAGISGVPEQEEGKRI